MRVISGKLKGRKIEGFDILGTRPTMDRVKESIFSMIQEYVPNAVVLDLFSGTGNYGIECLSNGASLVYFNDHNPKCVKVIKDNLINMGVLEYSKINNFDYRKALINYQSNHLKFDLVFLDPPYKKNIINEILDYLINNDLINKNGLIICEFIEKEEYISDKLVLFKEKKYGDKLVYIYKYDN